MAVSFGVAYHALFVLARESNPVGAFAPWFPPAGVMLAFFIAFGPRWLLWAVAVRVAAAEWWSDSAESFGYHLSQAVAICVSYATGASVLRWFGLERAHARQFGLFAVVGVGLTPLAAALLLTGLDVVALERSAADVFEETRVFWVGDALAVASIVPAALIGVHTWRVGRPRTVLARSRTHRFESTLQVAIVVAAPLAAASFATETGDAAILGILVLPLLWVALRQDLLETAIGIVVVVSLTAVSLRVQLPTDELLRFQYLLLCSTLAALFAAAVRRTYEDVAATMLDEQRRHHLLREHAPLAFTEFDSSGAIAATSSAASLSKATEDMVALELSKRWDHLRTTVLDRDEIASFDWTSGADVDFRAFSSTAMPLPLPDGEQMRVLVVSTERTALEHARADMRRALHYDPLTELPNRWYFLNLIERTLRSDPATALGVVVVDFETVRTRWGHPEVTIESRRIVRQIADRVQVVVRRDALVSRISDCAIAIATPCTSADELRQAAAYLLNALRPDDLGPVPAVDAPVAVGLAMGHGNGDRIIRQAERAAHHAASLGSDRVVPFHRTLLSGESDQRIPADEIRRACRDREFVPHYQPIVRLDDRSIIGFEALARWRHPSRGLLNPAEFIPTAVATGLITHIDDLIIQQVVAQLEEWQTLPGTPPGLTVSVNLSPVHLDDPSLPEQLISATSQLDGPQLHLEITESEAMVDPQRSELVLRQLSEAGFAISLDDFATGYSSMAWLHRLPVNALKIDRTFVASLSETSDSKRIVRLIIALARDLDLTVIAEGIETAEQADQLADLGCQLGQGYLFGRPASAEVHDRSWRNPSSAQGAEQGE